MDPMPVERDAILTLVSRLLREDLRLGAVPIAEETRLVGGDFELDSLDLLMLVSGVEKHYGKKLPSDRLGRSTMETVGRFTDFVHECMSGTAAAGRERRA